MASRSPNWTRDELILALDLFMRAGRKWLDEKDPAVIELSGILNSLPVHPGAERGAKYRNPNGVSMKLGNLLSRDPSYTGAGLNRGNRLEQVVWEEFAGDPKRLQRTASAIREAVSTLGIYGPNSQFADEEEFAEGRLLTRLHKQRERSPQAVARKKASVLQATGRLACEACDFDFSEVYGDLGSGFAECHHRMPVAELRAGQQTRLVDLAILCANCHRMIHKTRPLLSVAELREVILSLNSKAAEPG